MERSEPSFVPEWLKSGGSITGSGNSNNQFTSSSSHSDNHSALRHRNKLSVGSGHDIGRVPVVDRTTSAYFRSSSSNSSANSRSYSSFSKGHRERDWEKDINGYHDSEKAVLSDHGNRNYSDSLDSMLPSMFEKDVLRCSQSITANRSDTWPRKVTNDSSANIKSNHSSDNGLLSIVSPAVGNKSAFERDFPVLGAEERQVGSEIGRVSSPGLSTAVQSLPVGTSAVTGSDGWTSALADMPVGVGSSASSAAGVAVSSQNVSAGSASIAPATTTGLNMAETLAQGPSRAPPLLNVGTQRLEELAIKQSRQLIPLVTTSMPKTPVVSPSEKSKPKAGQQQHSSLSLNYTRGGTSRSDSLKVSTESRLRILKPSRESNGFSLTTKDNLSPTNGSNKLVNSPLSVSPSAAASPPFRSSGNSPRFTTADRNQTPFRITTEKRPTVQTQSRNDFFNLLKKKSTTNSASSVPDSGPAVSPSFPEKSDELGTEDSSTSVTLKDGGVPSSEISIADLQTDNRSEITHNGDAYAGSQQCSSNGDRHSNPDAFICPDEEEAAFLRSLGWEENAGDDEGLTEEEISAFFDEYMKLKPSAELFHLMQSIGPLNSRNGTHGGASSGLSSMNSNGEALTPQKF